MSRRVLFVCTGNICRSPFAEHAARSTHIGRQITFESAGTSAAAGSAATHTMVTIADEFGFDLRPHRSRPIDEVKWPDLVLCMERSHIDAAMAAFPDMEPGSIRLLGDQPIPDPYGHTEETYRACAATIVEAIETLDL